MSEHQPQMTMRESAIAMHEAFTSYMEAGFNRTEALYLTACMLRAPEPPREKGSES
ncbi:hypothetical protein [Nocardiopsis synnemataformans]|uniref:hypothetical protein n=1 Tax=Nocardiopsis synnemataformans TaxID=61305 RepID=UPI003EBD106C